MWIGVVEGRGGGRGKAFSSTATAAFSSSSSPPCCEGPGCASSQGKAATTSPSWPSSSPLRESQALCCDPLLRSPESLAGGGLSSAVSSSSSSSSSTSTSNTAPAPAKATLTSCAVSTAMPFTLTNTIPFFSPHCSAGFPGFTSTTFLPEYTIPRGAVGALRSTRMTVRGAGAVCSVYTVTSSVGSTASSVCSLTGWKSEGGDRVWGGSGDGMGGAAATSSGVCWGTTRRAFLVSTMAATPDAKKRSSRAPTTAYRIQDSSGQGPPPRSRVPSEVVSCATTLPSNGTPPAVEMATTEHVGMLDRTMRSKWLTKTWRDRFHCMLYSEVTLAYATPATGIVSDVACEVMTAPTVSPLRFVSATSTTTRRGVECPVRLTSTRNDPDWIHGMPKLVSSLGTSNTVACSPPAWGISNEVRRTSSIAMARLLCECLLLYHLTASSCTHGAHTQPPT
eukprot:Sspe_Gene.118087::Locus_110733_Transcript_1_1_Confidence_1.000_Length_2199::g.118087::m.118087